MATYTKSTGYKILKITGSCSTSDVTVYTVPAGKFARICAVKVNNNGGSVGFTMKKYERQANNSLSLVTIGNCGTTTTTKDAFTPLDYWGVEMKTVAGVVSAPATMLTQHLTEGESFVTIGSGAVAVNYLVYIMEFSPQA